MKTRAIFFLFVISLSLITSSCATIMNGARQQVKIYSDTEDAKIFLDGKYVGTDNYTANLKRSKNHTVTLKKDNCESKTIKIYKYPNWNYVALDIFFGLPGYIVDLCTSAWNEFNKSYTFKLDCENSNKPIVYSKKNLSINKTEPKKPINDIKTNSVSSIDINIPVNNISNENTFAIIIGNEEYQNEINVEYAINDVRSIEKYFQKTFGIPKTNIKKIENATYGQILGGLNWINNISKVFDGEAKIIFYYAGHGYPDEATKQAYILPVDGNSKVTETSISIESIYNKLSNYKTKHTIIILDACFTGSIRSEKYAMLDKTRGISIKPKRNELKNNMISINASSGSETALPLHQEKHGLFTYCFLDEIKKSQGNIKLEQLFTNLKKSVEKKSIINSNKPQTPEINYSLLMAEDWKVVNFLK